MLRLQILDRILSSDLFTRFFKVNIFKNQTVNVTQYNSGGDDYNPPPGCEGLGDNIGNNPKNGVVFAWRDCIERICEPGEKRIYSVNVSSWEVAASLHLKNDGDIVITGDKDLNIEFKGNASINVTGNASITVNGDVTQNINGSFNLTASNIQSSGVWTHSGNVAITGDLVNNGNLTANHIVALDGKTGALDCPIFTAGIALTENNP